MLKIQDFLKYEGDEVRQGVLYSKGCPFVVQGKVDFTVFGTVRLNGVVVSNTRMSVKLQKVSELVLDKDSAMLFHQVPSVVRHPIGEILPEVPEMQDEQIRMMHRLFESWVIARGLPAEGEGDSPSPMVEGDEMSIDEEYDDYDDIPLDTPLVDPLFEEKSGQEAADSHESDAESSSAVANSESLSELAQVTQPAAEPSQGEKADDSLESAAG